ncbi:Hydrogen cyanide synthase subunit HcnC [Paraburkholderia domus]|uniref:NAD(P)/FAD-dependent oxidoreductase n=1 Tax=Paraburkholderia domus TaxID=2793075 RepID=UPI0019135A1A|nr:FAD-dependent oxidoreductase [Paraburkholderia domus]MBK5091543.1 FAD-binding oxidoreductase [Burkholderia sp. R-69927]CAE6937573.1 Hydrogen cyanide synthase subunit HcnC [Paraburkholderia domus]
MNSSDVLVIGGGLVGTAIAYGLAREGLKVGVLDEGDEAFRASRGNFGLVWVQGKGYRMSPYATWTRGSATRWPMLREFLRSDTDIDVQLEQPGGFHFCFDEPEWQERAARLQAIRDDLNGDYPFEMIDHTELKRRLPAIGPQVTGASYSPMDGHVNPLKLLRALHTACGKRGVNMIAGVRAQRVERDGSGFVVEAGGQRFHAGRVVLAAGLGNRALAPQVGIRAPVAPNRGQVLIAERVAHFLDFPTTYVRQTDEGTVQIGDSMEDVGFNDGVTADVISHIAWRGVRSFPALGEVKLVRAWGALRVMSPDGFPIYQQSATCPGAFVVTCHSGVTLAAAHVLRIAPWIARDIAPAGLEHFSGERFLQTDKVFTHGH